MKYPPGYVEDDTKCLRLRKGIYGLKQAGRIWNQKFVSVLKGIGFVQLTSDSQVLQLRQGKSVFIISLHVDDACMATNDDQLHQKVLKMLEKEFLVKDMGNITYYLGIRVEQQDGSCTLTQDAYIDKLLATFKMELANEADTPGVPGQILSKQDCPETPEAKAEMEGKPYRQLVGSLMYGYCCTRPDIGSVLAKVASFCNNPGIPHWVSAKRILRYLKGTKSDSIQYTGRLAKGDKLQITAHCDSDWAQCPDDRKSTTGYVVQLAGGPIAWQCKKQPTHALSSTEAEFVAMTEAAKDVLWLQNFLTELGLPVETPTIFTDSQSAMEWARNAKHHQRNKHVALKYFFIRDLVNDRAVRMRFVSTDKNIADILTKPTTKSVFSKLKPTLMGWLSKVRW